MKTILKPVLALLFSLIFLNNFGRAADAPAAGDDRGTVMNFEFLHLEPGHIYRIDLKNGWFSHYVTDAPQELAFQHDRANLSFRAPAHPENNSKFAQVRFTVGGYFKLSSSDPSLGITVEAPQPAVVKLTIPSHDVSHTFIHDNRTGADPQLTNVHAKIALTKLGVDGCLEDVTCTLEQKCPTLFPDPVKCYGPIRARFWCCWNDPMRVH